MRQWDLLIRQARRVDMLARLYAKLVDADLLESIPSQPLRHLRWSYILTKRHRQSVILEVEELASTLSSLQVPLVVLKGAAYNCAKLSPADGRIFSDIDILLPKSLLPTAESLLLRKGWLSECKDSYDQKYYRKWMHELPPMRHTKRLTELDVHHAILPETAIVSPSSRRILSRIVAIEGMPNVYRLCNEDLILHSATHLFFDGEMTHALRDLEDVNSLLSAYCETDEDWERLLSRGLELELTYPLYYALYYCSTFFGAVIPEPVLKKSLGLTKMSRRHQLFMRFVFDRGLLPDHASCASRGSALARWLLYVRSHYLKMPFHLLIPHLAYKSVVLPIKKRMNESNPPKTKTLAQLLAEKNTQVQ
nr:nucleotidyltransferase family protein [Aestuariicella hydrocarbonica]